MRPNLLTKYFITLLFYRQLFYWQTKQSINLKTYPAQKIRAYLEVFKLFY